MEVLIAAVQNLQEVVASWRPLSIASRCSWRFSLHEIRHLEQSHHSRRHHSQVDVPPRDGIPDFMSVEKAGIEKNVPDLISSPPTNLFQETSNRARIAEDGNKFCKLELQVTKLDN